MMLDYPWFRLHSSVHSLDPTIVGGHYARIWMLEDCKGANLFPHSCQTLRGNE